MALRLTSKNYLKLSSTFMHLDEIKSKKIAYQCNVFSKIFIKLNERSPEFPMFLSGDRA